MQDVMEIMGDDLAKLIELAQANLKFLPTVINVQGYGAVGDGITDDTAAVQSAINAAIAAGGKVIYFPHGTYKVTTLTNAALVVFVGDNAKFSGISDLIYQFGAIPLSYLYRQAIINGNFDVWQRGTSWTNPSSGTYTADRWLVAYSNSGSLPNIAISQQTITPGDVFVASNYYHIAPDGSGSGFGATNVYYTSQKIENGTRYLCGSGKKVTVSFYARSTIPGKKIGIAAFQNYGSGGSSAEVLAGKYWVLTSTWTKYSYTFTTNALGGKTLGSGDYLQIAIHAMWGSTSALNVGDTVAETFGGSGSIDIGQVQVNAGDQALPFQLKSYSQEYIDSLRYRWQSWADGSASGVVGSLSGVAVASNALLVNVRYPVPMRTAPTISVQNNGVANQVRNSKTGAATAVTFVSVSNGSNKGFAAINFSGTPFTVGEYYDFDIIADSEL